MSVTTNERTQVKRNTARGSRGASRPETSEGTRFEFARRHIVQSQRLENQLEDARNALYDWRNFDARGLPIEQPRYAHFRASTPRKQRTPKTPEEREELKALQAAVVDARARLLLHENDGALL